MKKEDSKDVLLVGNALQLDLTAQFPPLGEPTLQEVQGTLRLLYNLPLHSPPPFACDYCKHYRQASNLETGCPVPLHGTYPIEGGCNKFEAREGTGASLDQKLQILMQKLIKDAKASG